ARSGPAAPGLSRLARSARTAGRRRSARSGHDRTAGRIENRKSKIENSTRRLVARRLRGDDAAGTRPARRAHALLRTCHDGLLPAARAEGRVAAPFHLVGG